MHDSRVGRRYAQALFEAASHLNVVQSVEDDLGAIVRLYESESDFRFFLVAPYSSRDEKIAVSEKMFADRVTALTMQALRLLLEKGREDEIPVIFREFVTLRRRAQGVVHIVVTSAESIDAAQRSALEARLRGQLGTTIEADYRIDPRIIGGVRVAYGNTVLDGSVRGALNRLRERLQYDLLKQA